MINILKKENGITLIALVVTIVVLLILAGISISMLTGENGVIKQASIAKIENRGAGVEEARDLWKTNQQSDKHTNSNSAQTLDELLNELLSKKLITDKEKNEIEETGQVTIGSRTIVFKDKEIKLEYYYSHYYNNSPIVNIFIPNEYIEKGITITYNNTNVYIDEWSNFFEIEIDNVGEYTFYANIENQKYVQTIKVEQYEIIMGELNNVKIYDFINKNYVKIDSVKIEIDNIETNLESSKIIDGEYAKVDDFLESYRFYKSNIITINGNNVDGNIYCTGWVS